METHPFRTGFADAVLGRVPANPYRNWAEFKKAQDYNSGFLRGVEARAGGKADHVTFDGLISCGVIGEIACNQD